MQANQNNDENSLSYDASLWPTLQLDNRMLGSWWDMASIKVKF